MDLLLPIALALVGIGGTIAVTVIQLRARRAELEDERAARAAADLEERREQVVGAVYDAMGPLIAAATIPHDERSRMSNDAAAAVARAARIIRLSRSHEFAALHEWWGSRTKQFAKAQLAQLERLEARTLAEISAWYEGELTADEILELARTDL